MLPRQATSVRAVSPVPPVRGHRAHPAPPPAAPPPRPAVPPRRRPGQRRHGQLPQRVVHGGLRFLDAVHRGRRRHEQVVQAVQLGHLAAVVAGDAHGEHAAAGRLVQGAQQVLGVAAGGQADGDVVGLPERGDLAGEHHLNADVVAQGGDHRDVVGQAEGGQGPLARAGIEEQRGQLLGVGGAAAVAEGQQPPAGGEPGGHLLCALGQPLRVLGADDPAQFGDLAGLGHGGRADLGQHRVQVGRSPAYRNG